MELGRLFADGVLEAAARPERGCWGMAGAVSPAALSQIRSSVSQSWITVSQAVCRTTRAMLRAYQLH